MAVSYPKFGDKVIAEAVDMKGDCTIGRQKGDEPGLSIHRCGDFCGYFCHYIFDWLSLLQIERKSPLGVEDSPVAG